MDWNSLKPEDCIRRFRAHIWWAPAAVWLGDCDYGLMVDPRSAHATAFDHPVSSAGTRVIAHLHAPQAARAALVRPASWARSLMAATVSSGTGGSDELFAGTTFVPSDTLIIPPVSPKAALAAISVASAACCWSRCRPVILSATVAVLMPLPADINFRKALIVHPDGSVTVFEGDLRPSLKFTGR